MSKHPYPTVSIIIPVHNGGEKFRRCLASVTRCSPAAQEIIVVADGQADDSWRVAEEFGTRVLRLSSSRGPAGARNRGAENAEGDVLFFVDADVTVTPDAVGHLSAVFRDCPDLAAVFGSYDDAPSETNFLSQYKNLLHHYTHQHAATEASTFWGACGAIRRKAFVAAGGFDESYRRPSIEDIELGYRLKRAGHRIRLQKDLEVKHLKRWEFKSLLKTDFLSRAIPWTELLLNEGGFINDLNINISSRLSVLSVYMLLLSFLGALFSRWLFVPALFFMTLLIVLNYDLYRFFRNKRGLGFAVKTIPWHWFYFFYSGLAFSIGFVQHKIQALTRKP